MSPETVAALMASATAIAGWLYTRRIGLGEARKALEETYRTHIAALEAESRLKDETIADRERRLKSCEAAIRTFEREQWNWSQRG